MKESTNLNETAMMLDLIRENLPGRLGPTYRYLYGTELLAHADIAAANLRTDPDAVIYDPTTKDLVIIEVKGGARGGELPLAVSASMKRLKQQLPSAKVVLVSTSHLVDALRDRLKHDDIYVVESHNPSQVVDEISKELSLGVLPAGSDL